MHTFAKPRVFVSRCLGLEACRYNGEIIREPLVERLLPYLEVVSHCPEKEIGLGVPRDPIRLVDAGQGPRLWQPAGGRDLTQAMVDYAAGLLEGLPELDGLILKSRSPSCGPSDVKIYLGYQKGAAARRGPGAFGGPAAERFADLPVEHEGRLRNFTIREHFLTRLFTLAEFRRAAAKGGMGDLVAFHSRHKLLLMACSQAGLRRLGRIVAGHRKGRAADTFAAYGPALKSALGRSARRGPVINALMHAMGYFSRQLNAGEKALFLDDLERYRAGRLPLSACQGVLAAWIARFGQEYLAGQSLFRPFPDDLVEISDSGKGRDY